MAMVMSGAMAGATIAALMPPDGWTTAELSVAAGVLLLLASLVRFLIFIWIAPEEDEEIVLSEDVPFPLIPQDRR